MRGNRKLQFSLRAVFLLVTISAVALGVVTSLPDWLALALILAFVSIQCIFEVFLLLGRCVGLNRDGNNAAPKKKSRPGGNGT